MGAASFGATPISTGEALVFWPFSSNSGDRILFLPAGGPERTANRLSRISASSVAGGLAFTTCFGIMTCWCALFDVYNGDVDREALEQTDEAVEDEEEMGTE